MRHCTNHCSGCGSHFTSLRAFDAHRSGDHAIARFCWAEENEEAQKLRPASLDGLCDQGGHLRERVTIWEHGPSADAAREAFRRETEIGSSEGFTHLRLVEDGT